MYRLQARSYIGGRCEQQDHAYAFLSDHAAFAVLCDGMGGTTDGKLASSSAISVMKSSFHDFYRQGNKSEIPRFLYHSMNTADEQVFSSLKGSPGGTTMVAAYLSNGYLYWLSVGDSRLYILRSHEFLQATRDHNYYMRLREMLENDTIAPQVYNQESTKGEALISYIGIGGVSLFDLTQQGMEVYPKDLILLSTDGLYRIVPEPILKEIITSELSLSEKADRLAHMVENCDHPELLDNTTFIIIEAQ